MSQNISLPDWEPKPTITELGADSDHPGILPYFDSERALVYRASTSEIHFLSSPSKMLKWIDGEIPSPRKWFLHSAKLSYNEEALEKAYKLFHGKVPENIVTLYTPIFQARALMQIDTSWCNAIIRESQKLWHGAMLTRIL